MWLILLYVLSAIVAIIFALIVWYSIAMKFAEIAEMKGHDGAPYFWYTFLLGVVGMLMVIALPEIPD